MATNMDEEQSLRECEAYVQMHGSFSIPTISRYPRSFPIKLFRNQISGFNVTISTKISLWEAICDFLLFYEIQSSSFVSVAQNHLAKEKKKHIISYNTVEHILAVYLRDPIPADTI